MSIAKSANGHIPARERTAPQVSSEFDAFLPSFGASQASEWAWIDEQFAKDYPRLFALLSKCLVGGKVRETAIMKVMCGDGAFKVCISDRQTQQTWWCTLDPKGDLLGAVESMLRDGRGDWRKDKQWVNRK